MTTLVFHYDNETFCIDCASQYDDSTGITLTADTSKAISEQVTHSVICDDCGILVVPTLA